MKRLFLVLCGILFLGLFASAQTNQPPEAVATATPTAGYAPLTVQFDASQSYDPEGSPLTFLWFFGDGSPYAEGAVVTHTYTSLGTFSALVDVSDSQGTNDTLQIAITVTTDPSVPHAVLTADKIWGKVPLNVCFDASKSWDLEGEQLAYTWDVFPAGPTHCCLPTLCHTFDTAGQYTVRVTVADNKGNSAQASVVIYAGVNGPPAANAGSDITGYTAQLIRLHGSGSDPDGDPISYWDWGLHQKPEVSSFNVWNYDRQDVNFISYTPGDYVLYLIVGDGALRSVPDYVTIHVVDNQPPEAIATVTPISNSPFMVQFDGSKSYDPEGRPLSYLWFFGDGSPYAEGAVVTHTYTSVGSFAALLDVSDEQGVNDTVQIPITVNSDPSVPHALVSADKTRGKIPLDVCFDASQSWDPEGSQLTYTWQVFKNGSAVSPLSCCLPTYCYTFVTEGRYEVWVTVADTQGYSAKAFVAVAAGVNGPPVANAGPDRTAHTEWSIVLHGTGNDPDGDPISYWHWAVQQIPPGASFLISNADGQDVTFAGRAPGDYVLQLTVGDGALMGLPDYVTVHVADNLKPEIIAAATPTSGYAPLTVQFDASQSYDPEGSPLSYLWFFGDGSPYAETAVVTHTYTGLGTFSALVDVSDEKGVNNTFQIRITVKTNPSIPHAILTADKIWGEVPLEVNCDASQSWDPEGDKLTFAWEIFVDGSPTGPIFCCDSSRSYTLDPAGVYEVRVTVQDSLLNSATASVLIYAGVNAPPVANAGPDQSVHVGATVTLDGSGSTDPNESYPLEYRWELLNRPDGSQAVLSDPAAVKPTFTVDKEGTYTASLGVKDSEGMWDTSPDYVEVNTTNVRPVADAGHDQSVTTVGTVVQLNGTSSSDADGDTITYAWTMTSKPETSQALLDSPSLPIPTFMADVKGEYLFSLIVSDPWAASDPDTVTVTYANVKPVAVAGSNQSAVVENAVTLNGSQSTDANGDPLTYSWNLVSQPEGSVAAIINPTSVTPTLIPDVPGTYVLSLVVNDGTETSDPSNMTVTAVSDLDAVTQQLMDTTTLINSLNPAVFSKKPMQKALADMVIDVLNLVQNGQYAEALGNLQESVLKRVDGCALRGAPDKNDWMVVCAAQIQVYTEVMEAITLLLGMGD